MCGIAGFTIGRRQLSIEHRVTLSDMLDAIAHRGPDQRATRVTDAIALGHDRLTIMEPAGGRQPRVHPQNHNTLIYNGEIYNPRAFDQQIAAAGGLLRDRCDTETLFWLIELFGIEPALRQIDGMFAFAFYRAQDNTLFLARDAFGQKPLFFAEANGELIFASEVGSIRKHPDFYQVNPDFEALNLYLMMEYVPGRPTGIEGIHELPPGHLLQFQNGGLRIEPYWRASDIERDSVVDQVSAARRLDRTLQQAVEQQLVADVPVGIFLSGGLDSSLVAAMASKNHADISTFTIKFPQSGFDESMYAEEVAKYIGTNHTTIELDRQSCVDGVADLVAKCDQPFADSSMLPSYLLCRETRRYVTVALAGDGADELFFGYPNFRLLKYASLMARLPAALGAAVRRLVGSLPQSQGYMNWQFLLRQLSYGFGKPSAMQSSYWMSAVAPNEQADLWTEGCDCERRLFEQISSQYSGYAGLALEQQCQRHFLECYLAYDILQKTDRASMYNSLEVRNPFLSAPVAALALTLPVNSSFRRSGGKGILKQLATDYLPERTINRKKHGFALPVSVLIRQELRETVASTLLNSSNSMYQQMRFSAVESYWNQHQSGQRDLGKKIWALFMLAAFFSRQF